MELKPLKRAPMEYIFALIMPRASTSNLKYMDAAPSPTPSALVIRLTVVRKATHVVKAKNAFRQRCSDKLKKIVKPTYYLIFLQPHIFLNAFHSCPISSNFYISYKKFSSSGRDLFCLITNNEGKSRRNACEYSVRAIHDHKFITTIKISLY